MADHMFPPGDPNLADRIAIIGLGCRFPGGADGPEAFWRLLEQGVNAVTEVPANRAGFNECFDADPKKLGHSYTRWGGFLDRVDLFDARFFGISPREAAHIDPQHRILLELLWEACEDAGLPPPDLAGSRTGVFIGISTHDYGDLQMYPSHRGEIDMHTNSGTATSIAANRLSYIYDLRGPSVAIDTACSSSLSAVHFACQSLRAGESDLAVAGGVQILLSPELTIGFCKASMLSPDGECRAFDRSANGYVRGEGAGVVLLKPLAAAMRDGDPIYAVIRATAINQDGRTTGMTVPSARAQQAMIEEALRKAGIAPGDVQYVEAHGPGTRVGDPIEASAISAALGRGGGAHETCAIGSVKTNLGHLEAASGMPGLIKVALALRHQKIPPSLHFQQSTDDVDLSALGLRVVTELEPWPHRDRPAIAGVNSFGFGGANAHVLLEGPPPVAAADDSETERPRLLALSARSPEALKVLAAAYADRLRAADTPRMRDVCFTAAERRAHHECRISMVAGRRDEFLGLLADFADGAAGPNLTSGRTPPDGPPKIAFVFSGMGPQWWGMGRQLRETEPVFRQMLQRCDEALRPHADWSLLAELSADEATSRVASPEIAQVTNFAIQVALADLWASFGITPAAVIGHSGGAMAAAYVAGVYDLDEAIRLSFHRSRLQGRPLNAGRMLAVGAPFAEIQPVLAGKTDSISLAAVNGPSALTLAGDGGTLELVATALLERQIFARFLPVTIAYHSPMMDPIKDEFLAAVDGLRGRPSRIPWLSDTTGTWAQGPECDAEYWWRAIRQPVLFRDGMRQLLDSGFSHFVEIAPHPVLTSSMLDCMKERGTPGMALPSLRRGDDERAVMLRSLGSLYTAGCMPRWPALREDRARLESLPRYPWQRERHWFEPAARGEGEVAGPPRGTADHPLLGVRLRSVKPAWESLAGIDGTAFLRQHIVQDSAVCPGAAYVEMALAARAAIDGDTSTFLRDVEFLKALRLDREGGTPVQVTFDPEDGRFEVFSGSGASWANHARGVTVAIRRSEGPQLDLETLRARCPDEVGTDDFYARMTRRGLAYGSAFHGIKRLWSSNREAVACVWNEDVTDDAAYRAHPALLDAAFQVLVAAAETDPDLAAGGRLFLPTKIRKLHFHERPGARFWVTANVTEASTTTVTGNVRLISETGRVMVDVLGLTARLIDATSNRGVETVDEWLYEYGWEAQPSHAVPGGQGLASASILSPRIIDEHVTGIRDRVNRASRQLGWSRYYDHVEARLDELAASFIVESFQRLGCPLQPGVRVSPDRLAAASPGDWRKPLIGQLFANLTAAGILRPAAGEWEATGATPRGSSTTLADQLLRDWPQHRLDVELVCRAGRRLADVIAGRADGRDVLFAGDGFSFLEQFYRASPASAFYNAQVADVISTLASGGISTRRLRVLEVGAGTGGTTSLLLPALIAGATDYVFTDTSSVFLDHARVKFKDYQFLKTMLFDVTKDIAAQGLEPASFDLVVAANVLHATPDVQAALSRLSDLLNPGGVVVLLEITRHPRWLDIVFGLIDGWWSAADRDRRPTHPLMPAGDWQTLMGECGLESVAIVADDAPGEAAQSIVMGRRPLVSTEDVGRSSDIGYQSRGHWVIFGDRTRSVGERLARRLTARGCDVSLHDPGQDLAVARRTVETLGDRAAGVIYLWSLDAPAISGDESFAQGQTCSSGSLLAVLQRVILGSRLAERQLVIVTAGAQTIDAGRAPALLQTPVWGFGRTVRREWPNLRCRLVDLGDECPDADVVALADEILTANPGGNAGADDEEEIAFRGAERFVHRLRRTSRARIADRTPAVVAEAGDGWRAELTVVGSLDSLILKRFDRQAPPQHEVEVAVEASSLNFRDVVVATGVVQGLESDDTFGSRRLGIDFAGTVTRCGAAVEHVKPGDEVFGIAQGSFASFVVTNAALVARRPAGMTAAQASTIPVAFITVWYALTRLARLAKGETVLVHAASGGVGLAAIQLAGLVGAQVFATAGSAAKRSFVESLGVDGVMDSRSFDFADEILERTHGRGVDVVLNSLPGEAIARGFAALAPYGRFVELGKADIYRNHRLELGPFKKNLSLYAVDLDRLCAERPEVVGDMLHEVAATFAAGGFRPVPYTTFDMTALADALRFMAQARHIGKVVVEKRDPVRIRPALSQQPPIRPDATYLITGGTGGLGIAVARWLVDRGATTIVLMARRPPTLADEVALEELRVSGAHVEAVVADVTKAELVRQAIGAVRSTRPPIRGIVHAAMVLEDMPLEKLDRESLDRVMAPKVCGAWNLHEATLGDPLDFFVSFSSITSVLGNPRQANYAAANAFLDAFASYRRAQGLPATTINWGVISGAGYVARHQEIEDLLNKQGYLSFSVEQTLDVVSELLRHDAVQMMAARIDWQRFGQFAPGVAASPQIRHLVPAAADETTPSGAGSMLTLLASEAPAARLARLEHYLCERTAKLLGSTPAAIDLERRITDLGLDSLIAVELTIVLERDLKVDMPVAKLLAGVSLRGLAGEIQKVLQLEPTGGRSEHDGRSASSPATPADAAPDSRAPDEEPNVLTPHVPAAPLMIERVPLQREEAPVAPPESPRAPDTDYAALDYSRWSPAQRAIKAVTSAGFSCLARIDARGLEHIPLQGPCLLAVNHLSMADVPLVLTLLPRRAIILAVDSLKRYRVLDWFVSDMGQAIYVPRGEADDESLRRALTVLQSGGLLALAPEGTRSKAGGLLRGRTGIAYLATRADVPVVPLVAWGQERWRSRLKHVRRIPIHVRAGRPIRFRAGPASSAELREYTDQVMTALAALLPPEYQGVYRSRVEDAGVSEHMQRDRIGSAR